MRRPPHGGYPTPDARRELTLLPKDTDPPGSESPPHPLEARQAPTLDSVLAQATDLAAQARELLELARSLRR